MLFSLRKIEGTTSHKNEELKIHFTSCFREGTINTIFLLRMIKNIASFDAKGLKIAYFAVTLPDICDEKACVQF